MGVEERTLGAKEEGGREERAGARALLAEHREPVPEQGGEEESRKPPRLRVGEDVQLAREDEVRGREEELRQARMLEVVRPVALGRADRGTGVMEQDDEP